MLTSYSSFEDFLSSFRGTTSVYHLHALICQSGLDAYPCLGSQLISSLADAQDIGPAQQVFHKLIHQDAYCWNSLITGCVRCEDFQSARNAFNHIERNDCLQPSVHAYVALLKACAKTQDIEWGCKLYTRMAQNGMLEDDNFAGSALINMFAKCGSVEKAYVVFEKLLNQDVVSWNALITGYVDQEKGDKALECFEKMRQLGVPFSPVTLVSCLVACCSSGNLIKGQEIHTEALKRGFEVESSVGNSLVDMYAKSGKLDIAQNVFENLTLRDIVSWNVIMTGLVESGCFEDALCLFERMHRNAVSPNDVTFLSGVKACASLGTREMGWGLHDQVIKFGHEKDSLIANTLVDMYAKVGSLETAEQLMDTLSTADIVLWNAIVAAYADYGLTNDALRSLDKMHCVRISPNFVTFTSLVKGCSSVESLSKGQEIHASAVIHGCENELLLGSALVDMYCKCGFLLDARCAFDRLQVRNIVTWNSLMSGFSKLGHGDEVFRCLSEMKNDGVFPCATTFACLLKACSSVGASNKHGEVYIEITKLGLDEELLIGNVLIDVYMKFGCLSESEHTFYKLSSRDLVSWSSMISGLTESGLYEHTLDFLEKMQNGGFSPNSVIYICSIKACSDLGAPVKGLGLHMAALKQGMESDSMVGNVLVDMYASSACLPEARHTFEALSIKEVVAWNALMSGYAQVGECEEVIEVFNRMVEEGGKPDHITFLSILHACSHTGVVDRGLQVFDAIINDHGLLPTLKQYTCIVDVLGRAGFVEKAVDLIEQIPFQPDAAVWLLFLGACRKWANVDIGKLAFEQAAELAEGDCTPYVCMSNIYRDASMFEEARKVEALRLNQKGWNFQTLLTSWYL